MKANPARFSFFDVPERAKTLLEAAERNRIRLFSSSEVARVNRRFPFFRRLHARSEVRPDQRPILVQNREDADDQRL